MALGRFLILVRSVWRVFISCHCVQLEQVELNHIAAQSIRGGHFFSWIPHLASGVTIAMPSDPHRGNLWPEGHQTGSEGHLWLEDSKSTSLIGYNLPFPYLHLCNWHIDQLTPFHTVSSTSLSLYSAKFNIEVAVHDSFKGALNRKGFLYFCLHWGTCKIHKGGDKYFLDFWGSLKSHYSCLVMTGKSLHLQGAFGLASSQPASPLPPDDLRIPSLVNISILIWETAWQQRHYVGAGLSEQSRY